MSKQENSRGAERVIGYTFRNRRIIKDALTQNANKRLAFLGDKVVALMLIDHWYRSNRSCSMICSRPSSIFADGS
ncbi:hypothetical protein BGW36DRAFT_383866 [Talaromyces proteolyticus]|uniref:RNase III domain-containing protein n=1 Tax=Talaromyces proteolyticus TaxID=1131652 RepID=A0AAD4KQG6_9EURO|nr:uncharacterized protein BGW36DRAFT_383866 [Talaromyces proteolyticus]KAH8693854.1 hypothetical protein BGW36DRAFT_383866 [Talaromyces proteolyticus]